MKILRNTLFYILCMEGRNKFSQKVYVNLDEVINKLLSANTTSVENFVPLKESVIKNLCLLTTDILMTESALLELVPPINVFGNIHGQFHDLLRWFDMIGFPPKENFLFLGDYVDRGPHGIEVMCLLMACKIKYPKNVFLLRGNHECTNLNLAYGFYDECKNKYTYKLWKAFSKVFDCLPIAALIQQRIFCCHGGLSPKLKDFEQIKLIQRPTDIPEEGLLCDLVWSDPSRKTKTWAQNERGISYYFGAEVVKNFTNEHNLDLICRSHQVVQDGYEYFANKKLVTIFSAPNYFGEFDNDGGVMVIDQTLNCTFKILKSTAIKDTAEQTGFQNYFLINQCG